MYIEYYKIRKGTPNPRRANPSDAGMDLAYWPDSGEAIVIKPGDSVICATGLKFGVPHKHMLQIMNRSSIAAKRSLIVGACVVDAGYDGEVFINLHNVGQHERVVEPGDRIAQAVLVPIVDAMPIESSSDDLYSRIQVNSERGDGALGSTDV